MTEWPTPPLWLRVGVVVWWALFVLLVATIATMEWRTARRWRDTMDKIEGAAGRCVKCKDVTDVDDLTNCPSCGVVICPSCSNENDLCIDCWADRMGDNRQ